MNQIKDRKEFSERKLSAIHNDLNDNPDISVGKACIYATGSFGRYEACGNSDLDSFILGRLHEAEDIRDLKRLNEICIKADLIKSVRENSIPDFDGDGKYLAHYTKKDLIETLGRPEDDANNTFTARLLLLLESKPVVGFDLYKEIKDEVLSAYWQDFRDHQDEFVPAFLANDILRLWRTFCVNYESSTRSFGKSPNQNGDASPKRKVKNYKLKFSRLLTCFSALAYLSYIYSSKKTVTLDDAIRMSDCTPIERIQEIGSHDKDIDIGNISQNILSIYEKFLFITSESKEHLIQNFSDKDYAVDRFQEAEEFGREIYRFLTKISDRNQENRFHRLLLV